MYLMLGEKKRYVHRFRSIGRRPMVAGRQGEGRMGAINDKPSGGDKTACSGRPFASPPLALFTV